MDGLQRMYILCTLCFQVSVSWRKKFYLSLSLSLFCSFLLIFAHFFMISFFSVFCLSLCVLALLYIYIPVYIYSENVFWNVTVSNNLWCVVCVSSNDLYIYIYTCSNLLHIYIKLSSLHGNTLFYFLHFSTIFFLHFFFLNITQHTHRYFIFVDWWSRAMLVNEWSASKIFFWCCYPCINFICDDNSFADISLFLFT